VSVLFVAVQRQPLARFRNAEFGQSLPLIGANRTSLDQRHHPPLRLGVSCDVTLRGGEAGVAGELLHVA
jgi:hypothetical protein